MPFKIQIANIHHELYCVPNFEFINFIKLSKGSAQKNKNKNAM